MATERRDLIISFPDQSEPFTLGYEAGMLDERMQHGGKTEITMTVHVGNIEVICRLCAAYGWECDDKQSIDEAGEVYDEWRVVTLRKAPEATDRPRVGLRVVT